MADPGRGVLAHRGRKLTCGASQRRHIQFFVYAAVPALASGQSDVDRTDPLDRLRIASNPATCLVDLFHPGREAFRAVAEPGVPGVPALRIGHGDIEHAFTRGPDHQRWSLRTRSWWHDQAVVETG